MDISGIFQPKIPIDDAYVGKTLTAQVLRSLALSAKARYQACGQRVD